MKFTRARSLRTPALVLGLLAMGAGGVGCSADDGGEPGGSAGTTASGSGGAGTTAGTSSSGGKPSAGAASGGATPSGGTSVTVAGTTSGGATQGGSAPNGGSPPNGGAATGGASMAGAATGGAAMAGAATGGGGGQGSGTCTAPKATGKTVTGTGPHQVVIETNSENGIKCGTIYRPKDMGGTDKYPIFVWGEGGCSQDGYSNQAAMGEIASWGYFVVADGTPGGTNACASNQNGKSLLDFVTWAIAENGKSCSPYYQSLETTKVAADGFSCGGLMAENASGDPRFTAVGITSSGLMSSNAGLYSKIHTPFKIMNGGSSDVAYENGLRDYDAISALGKPILYLSKNSAGHGGDLGNGRGDFNKVNLAWLNWQLKGDMGATGKGYLTGSTCSICTDSGWTYKATNLP